jgi:hypothetical protein
MNLDLFTLVHIAISLVGVASGFVVLGGFFARAELRLANHVFLTSTILTSATGFLFPFTGLLPSHVVGLVSLLVLAVASYAYCRLGATPRGRGLYVVTATIALYLNVFVLAVQTFVKNPALQKLAPTQSEAPFAIVQLLILVVFALAGVTAFRRVRTV